MATETQPAAQLGFSPWVFDHFEGRDGAWVSSNDVLHYVVEERVAYGNWYAFAVWHDNGAVHESMIWPTKEAAMEWLTSGEWI